jgi:hypothetical protein
MPPRRLTSPAGGTSNQRVGIQGVANTDNATNSTGALQYGSDGDVAVDDSGNFHHKSLEFDLVRSGVNQAASTSGW